MKNPKLSSIVLWSVVSAAFIGPGTITTAVTAGSSYGLDLLWAIFFSAIACLILQEIAARITIASGKNLGQVLTQKFGTRKGRFLKFFIGGSVILGCAAYEAGNILGAVSGLNLLTGIDAGGTVLGVRVVSHRETPGLGDPIELEKSDWILGFTGRSLLEPRNSGWAVKRDGGEFDQFTGATITPRAVVQAVKQANLLYQHQGS